MWNFSPQIQRGFTLVEIAIAVVIMGLLLGGAVLTLSAQMDLRNRNETQRTLEAARDALIGHMVSQGRMPCPATTGSTGVEAKSPTAACISSTELFPAATLGVAPTDSNGYLVDAWGNRIVYVITTWQDGSSGFSDFIFPSHRVANTKFADYVRLKGFPTPPAGPNLHICGSSTGIGSSNCDSAPKIAENVVAVIYSLGKNGVDETKTVQSKIFVHRDQAPAGEYDDQVLWLSPYTLYDRLLSAGAL